MKKQNIWNGLEWPFVFITATFGAEMLLQKNPNSPWFWVLFPFLAFSGWKMVSPFVMAMDKTARAGQPSAGSKFVRALKLNREIEKDLTEWAGRRRFQLHASSSADRIVYMKARIWLSPIFVAVTKTGSPQLECWAQMVRTAVPVDGKWVPLIPQKIAFADLNDLLSMLQEPPVQPQDASEPFRFRQASRAPSGAKDLSEAWSDLKRRTWACLGLIALAIVVYGGVRFYYGNVPDQVLLERLGFSESQFMAGLYIYLGIAIAAAIWMHAFRCPRCHQKFFKQLGSPRAHGLARHCMNCGLKKYSESA